MPVVTVVGASGSIVPVTVNGAAAFSLAQNYAAAVNGLAFSGGLSAANLTPGGTAPTVAGGKVGEGVILNTGSFSFPTGYRYVTSNAAGPVTVDAGMMTSSTSVLAGIGGTTLFGGTGGGVFIAGGGSNAFDGAATGNYVIATGDGNDSIYGSGGNDLIEDGAGSNQVFTGTGNDTVFAQGTDSVVEGAGSAAPPAPCSAAPAPR